MAASAPDRSAATPHDAIFARKTLMDTVDDALNKVEKAGRSETIDLDDAREVADTMSVMLMAFPHLFPPTTNRWKPAGDFDPATDTLASPEVWTKFADFYRRAGGASRIAFRLGRAGSAAEFKALTADLRGACESCHALYLKVQ